MLLIKKVDKAIRGLNKTLALTNIEQKERQQILEQLSTLTELKQYIASGVWLRSDARERFLMLLANNFDYTSVSEQLGISKDSLRVSISYNSKKLEDILGEDIVEKILNGNIEDAKSRIRVNAGTMKLTELYPKEVLNLLPRDRKDNLLTLADCKAEAALLAELTMIRQRARISSIDKDKIAHILAILKSNKEKDVYQKNFLLKYLQGQATWEECLIKPAKKISVYAEDAIFDQYVFNKLHNAISSTLRKLSDANSEAEESVLLRKLQALKEIEKFIKSYQWIPEDKGKTAKVDVLNALFDSNFDYQRVAEGFSVSLKQLENFVSRESKNLLQAIGHDTLDLIIQDEVEKGMVQYFSNTRNKALVG